MRSHHRYPASFLGLLLSIAALLQAAPAASAATSSWQFETDSYEFAPARYGAGPAESHRFTLTNTGESPIQAKTWGFRWSTAWADDPTSFPVTSSNCSKRTLQPGESCTVDVSFSPLHAGRAYGAVMVKSQEEEVPIAEVGLGGEGTGPTIPATPESLDFGNVEVGTTSAPQVVTLEEQSTIYDYRLNHILIADDEELVPSSGPFKIVGGTCQAGLQLNLGKTCTVEIVMAPTASGPSRSQLHVVDVAPDAPQTVGLAGNAVPAAARIESPLVTPAANSPSPAPPATDPVVGPSVPPPATKPRLVCPKGKRKALRHGRSTCISAVHHHRRHKSSNG